jgi:hypothetical protein
VLEVQVVVPRENVQFSSEAGLAFAIADAWDVVKVAGAVGVLQAPRRMEARATAVARDIMGDSLCGEVCRDYS